MGAVLDGGVEAVYVRTSQTVGGVVQGARLGWVCTGW